MTGHEYTAFTQTTNRYPADKMLLCLLAGLTSEVGEINDKIKKAFRDKNGYINPADVITEGGDACWYLSELFRYFGFTMGDAMEQNVTKLTDRKNRDVLHGSGDHR